MKSSVKKSIMLSPVQRWFALVLVVANIGFNYFAPSFSTDGRSIREISDQYNNLFMPAPYAFAIWGVIYVAVFVLAIVQVLPGQKHDKAYHELSFPISLISILSMCWVLSFMNELLGVSEVIIVAMLITAVFALITAQGLVSKNQLGQWALVPFSLYAGWLSVATIANTAAWLVSEGYNGGTLGPEEWSVAMVLLAVAVGFVVSFKYRDVVFPCVIAWGIIAIWANWQTPSLVANTALAGGILLGIAGVVNMLRHDYSARQTTKRNHVLHKG